MKRKIEKKGKNRKKEKQERQEIKINQDGKTERHLE
jgi:hypothetical protein